MPTSDKNDIDNKTQNDDIFLEKDVDEKAIQETKVEYDYKKRIFPASFRTLYPIRIRDKTNSFKANVLRFIQLTDICIVPFARDEKELFDSLFSIFGTKGTKTYFKNYVYPRKYITRSNIIPSKNKIVITNKTSKEKIVSKYSEKKFLIGPLLRSRKNTIFDFTGIINDMYPTDTIMKHSKILSKKYSEGIILDMITYILSGEPNFYMKRCKNSLPAPVEYFNNIIVPVRLKTTNKNYISYLRKEVELPRGMKTNFEELYSFSLINFILKIIKDPGYIYEFGIEDNSFRTFKNIIMNKDIYIIFYSENYAFIVNFIDIIKRSKLKYNTILVKILNCVNILIRDNRNEIDEEEVNNIINDITSDKLLEDVVNTEKDYDKIESGKESISEKDLSVKIDTDGELKNINDIKNNIDLMKISSSVEKYDEIKKNAKIKNIISKNIENVEDVDTILEKVNEKLPGNITPDERSIFEEVNLDKFKENIKSVVAPVKTVAQTQRIEKIKNIYKTIKVEDNRTVDEIINDVHAKTIDINIGDTKLRNPKNATSIVTDFDKSYLQKTFIQDTYKIVKFFSENKSINSYITSVEKEDTSDNLNQKYTYKFALEDENHKKHTVTFDIPKIDNEGMMFINGNKKILKKQFLKLPVVKLEPDRVFMTSLYNNCIVYRQGTKVNNECIKLMKLLDDLSNDERFKKRLVIKYGNNTKNNRGFVSTLEFDELARVYDSIEINTKTIKKIFSFNMKLLNNRIEELKLQNTYPVDEIPIGIDLDELKVISVSKNPEVSSDSVPTTILKSIIEAELDDTVEEKLNSMNFVKNRIYSRILIQSKEVPLIVFLGSLFGLLTVLKTMRAKVHISEKKLNLKNKASIKFKNCYLYYDEYPIEVALMLNGLFQMDTENFDLEEFETEKPYLEYIYEKYRTRNFIKGWIAFKELFIDLITKEILIDMKLPHDFLELFIYVNSLLSDNDHDHESNSYIYRVRGYEIINEFIYTKLASQYRLLMKAGKNSKISLSIPRDSIIQQLNNSHLLENYDCTNPLNEIKYKSIVTFKGPKGINEERAIKLDKRSVNNTMIGVVGISNVEGKGVGIIKELTVNTRLVSTRGYIGAPETDKINKMDITQLGTAEELSIPFVLNHDDPKRIMFTAGQTKHVVPVKYSSKPLISTGYDKNVINIVSDNFAHKAKGDGVCEKIDYDNKKIFLKYKDGNTEVVTFGDIMNRNSNIYIGNSLEVNVKEGQKIKKGDIITYNKYFFKKLPTGQFIVTQGVLARLCIIEDEGNEEDSCIITENLSKKMITEIIKRKQVTILPNTNIISIRSIGDYVKEGEPLMVFEDVNARIEKESGSNLNTIKDVFGEIEEDVANSIMRHVPKANKTGTIKDINVYWTIPEDQMSESCAKLVKNYKKYIMGKIKAEEEITGKKSPLRIKLETTVPVNGRINGEQIDQELGGLVIEFFISNDSVLVGGDKISMHSSLKSIISRVVSKELSPFTESGEDIDGTISLMSISARMVNSIYIAGFLNKLIYDFSHRVAKEYLEE